MWNHRLVREHDERSGCDIVKVCEVYYDDAGAPYGFCEAEALWTSEDAAYDGDAPTSVRKYLEWMLAACNTSVLTHPGDFNGKAPGSDPYDRSEVLSLDSLKAELDALIEADDPGGEK